MFNREKFFQNKNIHDQLKLFIETIVNIVSNYVPNKCITNYDRDSPWLIYHIKRYIYQKNEICDALRNLVLFVRFKKREKHPWRSVNFSKTAG